MVTVLDSWPKGRAFSVPLKELQVVEFSEAVNTTCPVITSWFWGLLVIVAAAVVVDTKKARELSQFGVQHVKVGP